MAYTNFATKIILIACALFILVLLIIQYNKKGSLFYNNQETKETYDNPLIQTTERSNDNVTINNNNIIGMNATGLNVNNDNTIKNNTTTVSRDSLNNAANTLVNKDSCGNNILASESTFNEDYKAVDYSTQKVFPNECYPRDKLTAEDLLPKDAANSKWAEVNPAGQGDVSNGNFLSAGVHIGIDTQGQSLRNANQQIRSEPPNPKITVGPWNQSTIEFDQSRKHFEINEC